HLELKQQHVRRSDLLLMVADYAGGQLAICAGGHDDDILSRQIDSNHSRAGGSFFRERNSADIYALSLEPVTVRASIGICADAADHGYRGALAGSGHGLICPFASEAPDES